MTKEIFIKYLQGECSEAEFEHFLKWIKEDSFHTSDKGMIQAIWDNYEPLDENTKKIKYAQVLDKIHHRINLNKNPEANEVPKIEKGNKILLLLTRAAAILLFPVLLMLLYTHVTNKEQYASNLNDIEVEAPSGSRMHIQLGDGTKVWLNHGSKLKYPIQFKGAIRKVHLIGEAYFEVAHNPKVPFIVGTANLDVKATGTAFNVSAYPGDDNIATTLVEGKVILSQSDSNREIFALSPGECLKFDTKKNEYTLESQNIEKYIVWKDGLLQFKNDRVEDVAKRLARWFNVEVEIDDKKVNEFTFTATFMDETLPQILELMTLATPVKYQLTSQKRMPDGSFSKQKILIGLKKYDKK